MDSAQVVNFIINGGWKLYQYNEDDFFIIANKLFF